MSDEEEGVLASEGSDASVLATSWAFFSFFLRKFGMMAFKDGKLVDG